eukprot:9984933-Alexandrium_andersonii.AAC.1
MVAIPPGYIIISVSVGVSEGLRFGIFKEGESDLAQMVAKSVDVMMEHFPGLKDDDRHQHWQQYICAGIA